MYIYVHMYMHLCMCAHAHSYSMSASILQYFNNVDIGKWYNKSNGHSILLVFLKLVVL